MVLDTPEQINAFQLLTLKAALELECKGMTHSKGFRASVQVRGILQSKTRDKAKLLGEYVAYLKGLGVLKA